MKHGPQRFNAQEHVIRFATAKSSIGWLLVAATTRGICAVDLGDDSDSLVNRLRRRLASTTPAVGNDPLLRWTKRIGQNLAAPVGRTAAPPLHLRGSPFQLQVWRALRKIPVGKTVSYTDIAAKIGRPNAVRAVARACASNTVALLVPCHRVIRSDGGVSGYRWGVKRKRALLKIETESIGHGRS